METPADKNELLPSMRALQLKCPNTVVSNGIRYEQYRDERDLLKIMKLVEKDLSEPYSIFTYRYFVHQWPELCILAYADDGFEEDPSERGVEPVIDGTLSSKDKLVGVVVCKIDTEDNLINGQPSPNRISCSKSGYIGMLAVDKTQRKKGIGTYLVCQVIRRMRDLHGCSNIMLETEVTNKGAMRLYERLGFIREELLKNYYLNWNDAYRLRLWFDSTKS